MTERISRRPAVAAVAVEAGRAFFARFGRRPDWLVVAPGRVNLIGEHTDYNDGFVLPMAIERCVAIAACRVEAAEPRLRVHSSAVDQSVDIAFDSDGKDEPGAWSNYVRGVVAGFRAWRERGERGERGERYKAIPSIDALVASDLPPGGGLSSSAAIEVATATLLETATGVDLTAHDKVKLCQQAEHEYAGVPCGVMDQMASVLGDRRGPLLIDCRSGATRTVPMTAEVAVVVSNTGVRHALGDGEYARRRAECERAAQGLGVTSLRDATAAMIDAAGAVLDPVARRRARHVVTENERTLAAAAAIERGDFDAVGRLFGESHRSLRDDFEVSCSELDILVEAAGDLGPSAGVYGARMTGGGFGGCTVTLVRTDGTAEVVAELKRRYQHRTGRTLEAFVTRPAAGARRLDVGVLGGVPA
jgi:galactokinase